VWLLLLLLASKKSEKSALGDEINGQTVGQVSDGTVLKLLLSC